MGRLDGKITVISGAGPGFGRTTAELFAKEGAKVVAVDIREDYAKETADIINKNGGKAIYAVADIRELDQVK
ncbi:MAG: SDR family NAD(P)-dependent oxidoreductase, partial [Eubacteriales bacterium]|nr:SDR family NAD(P)-dependent oxidoreductase [Eubacteriales bacterium]